MSCVSGACVLISPSITYLEVRDCRVQSSFVSMRCWGVLRCPGSMESIPFLAVIIISKLSELCNTVSYWPASSDISEWSREAVDFFLCIIVLSMQLRSISVIVSLSVHQGCSTHLSLCSLSVTTPCRDTFVVVLRVLLVVISLDLVLQSVVHEEVLYIYVSSCAQGCPASWVRL